MPPRAPIKKVNGQLHRLCQGPSHDMPTWLPLTEKYFYPRQGSSTGFRSRCRLCELWVYSGDIAHGLIPVRQVQHYFTEGINRVGKVEFARRIGIHHTNLDKIVNGPRKTVRKETVRRCLLEIISIRRKHEVRHKNSISRGSNLRGEAEQEVKSQGDLYLPYRARIERLEIEEYVAEL